MNAPRKRISTSAKTTATGLGSGTALTYAALWASQKWGVPIEVTAPAVGAAFAFIARWAGRLSP